MQKLLLIFIFSLTAISQEIDPSKREFYQHDSGNYLDQSSRGIKNTITHGSGYEFGLNEQKAYCELKKSNKSNIQWSLKNLSLNQTIDESKKVNERFYGASVSKIFTAGAFFNNKALNDEMVTKKERQDLIDMIVRSSNQAWGALQTAIGEGSNRKGMELTQEFAKSIGIHDSTVFRGDLTGVHGNEITVCDTQRFMQATFSQEYEWAHEVLKLFFISRTGAKRLKKYLPKTLIVGGKTGSYTGMTRLNGKPINSSAVNHVIIFENEGEYYSLVALSDPGVEEDLAILAGGLFFEKIHGVISCD